MKKRLGKKVPHGWPSAWYWLAMQEAIRSAGTRYAVPGVLVSGVCGMDTGYVRQALGEFLLVAAIHRTELSGKS